MNKNIIGKIAILSLGAAVLLQFIMPFVYPIVGHDAAVHLNWLEQFPKLFREGNLYPRWMPDSFWGFGSPAFYFYPPLTYWVSGCISLIFPYVSAVTLFVIVGWIFTCCSAGTCYFYLRGIMVDRWPATIGALLYAILPYRFVDLYVRNALSEHASFIFFPIIFLAIEIAISNYPLTKREKLLSTVLSIIGWAGLLMTNIPMSVIGIYSVPIYGILRSFKHRRHWQLAFPLGGSFIALAIAAVYWVPISPLISEIKLSHLWDISYAEGETGYALLDVTSHGHLHLFFVSVNLCILISCLILYISVRFSKQFMSYRDMLSAWNVILFISLIFQIPYVLKPLWDVLPLMNLMQFTWRWQSLGTLAAVACITMIVSSGHSKRRINWSITTISLLSLLLSLGGYVYFFSGLFSQPLPSKKLESIDAPEYVSRFASNNYDTVISSYRAHRNDPDVIVVNGLLTHSQFFPTEEERGELHFQVGGSTGRCNVVFHTIYFPTWHLFDDGGNEYPIGADSIGRIVATLPQGDRNYVLKLVKTNQERIGYWISIAGLGIFGLLGVITILSRRQATSF